MIKIKENLFEIVATFLFLALLGCLCITLILVLSLFGTQDGDFYTALIVAYSGCLLLLVVSIVAALLLTQKTVYFFDGKIKFHNREYQIDKIRDCHYHVCKWYMMPVFPVYKKGVGGLLEINFTNGHKICFKIFYNNYLEIKEIIPNIFLK